MWVRSITIISLVLNVSVVAAILSSNQNRPSMPLRARRVAPASDLTNTSSPLLSGTAPSQTNVFHWRQLESQDYRQYIANLRTVGCPEATIRDIIEADIEQSFARKHAFTGISTLPVWSLGEERNALAKQRHLAALGLIREKEATLHDLIGVGWSELGSDTFDDLAEQAILQFLSGPMSFEKTRQVRAELNRCRTLTDLVESTYKDEPYEAEDAAVAAIRAETVSRLQALLTPAEVHELALRISAITAGERVLGEFQPTKIELRGIAQIFYEINGWVPILDLEFFGSPVSKARKSELVARLQQFLGPDRFANLLEHGKLEVSQ